MHLAAGMRAILAAIVACLACGIAPSCDALADVRTLQVGVKVWVHLGLFPKGVLCSHGCLCRNCDCISI